MANFSKTFDCIDHNLLKAKLNAYLFEKQLTDFTYFYLNKRKQRTKVNYTVNSLEMLFSCVPEVSILGPLLFKYVFVITPTNSDFAGYADDYTPYTYSSFIENVLDNLQGALEKMFHAFQQITR